MLVTVMFVCPSVCSCCLHFNWTVSVSDHGLVDHSISLQTKSSASGEPYASLIMDSGKWVLLKHNSRDDGMAYPKPFGV